MPICEGTVTWKEYLKINYHQTISHVVSVIAVELKIWNRLISNLCIVLIALRTSSTGQPYFKPICKWIDMKLHICVCDLRSVFVCVCVREGEREREEPPFSTECYLHSCNLQELCMFLLVHLHLISSIFLSLFLVVCSPSHSLSYIFPQRVSLLWKHPVPT